MKRPVIAILSILKPLDDTRLYEKIGLSLGESTKYEVNIIGFPANKPQDAPNINFFPLPFFRRQSWRRFMIPWKILDILQKIRPDLIISSTPELIPALLWYHRQHSFRWIYDVQENYRLNLTSQRHYPWGIRHLLAGMVTLLEKLARPHTDHYLLAESIYAEQLQGLDGRFTVLENKYMGNPGIPRNRTRRKLVFSGTLAPHTGVLKAVEVARDLHDVDEAVCLHIIGFAPDAGFRDHLQDLVADCPWVTLTSGEKPVAHDDILRALDLADAGIIWYGGHLSTTGKIPTKLYEYLALGLPFFLEPRTDWVRLAGTYDAAIPLTDQDPNSLLKEWKSKVFYTRNPGIELTWEEEKHILMKVVKSTLSFQ